MDAKYNRHKICIIVDHGEEGFEHYGIVYDEDTLVAVMHNHGVVEQFDVSGDTKKAAMGIARAIMMALGRTPYKYTWDEYADSEIWNEKAWKRK